MSNYLINGNGSTFLTDGIKTIIRESKSYIKACNFLFQDAEIVKLLKDASDRGVAIFIISNIQLNDYLEEEEGKKNRQKNDNTTLPNLNDLKNKGCHVHLLKELHAKFIIGDGTRGIIMSANFASNSISYNTETGLYVYNEELHDLEYIFEMLYLSSDITDIDKDEKRNVFSKKTRQVKVDMQQHLKSRVRFTIASQKKDNNLSECQITSIYDSILNIINQANKELYIVTWHFKALNHLPGFIDSIKKAINRGVKVIVYSNMYGQGSNSLGPSLDEVKKLEKIGCATYGDDNNHSKCVVSENEGILFTANIDGISGMLCGFETGCILLKDDCTSAVNHIKSLISKIDNSKKQ